MQDPKIAPPASEPRQFLAWGWVKSPWKLLTVGSVVVLILWIGVGIGIEYRMTATLEEFRKMPGVKMSTSMSMPNRFPAWLPNWLGKRLPEELALEILIENVVEFSQPVTDQHLTLLNRLPEIGWLRFHGASKISDEALLELIEKQPLYNLEFRPSRKLTPQHLAALADKQGFYYLNGVQGPFDQTTLDAITEMRELDTIHLDGPLSGSASIEKLCRLPGLTILEWDRSELSDSQFIRIVDSPKLCRLKLRKTQLTARSWPLFETIRSKTVHTLELESPHIDDRLIPSLVRMGTLASDIRLRGGNLSDRGVEELLRGTRPIDLEVDARGLTVDSARLIQERGRLRNVTVRGETNVTDEWLRELADEPFKELSILNSAITDDGVECLKDHRLLQRLALPGSRITDQCMVIFGTLPELECVDLRNTAITDAGLRQFSFSRKTNYTKWLHLGGTGVTRKGVEEFLARHPEVSVQGVEGIQPSNDWEWVSPLD